MRKDLKERFLEKVTKTDSCWIWQAAKSSGYGTIRNENQKIENAHRVSYRLFKKNNIPDSLVVMHKCDNKLCVNPKHLILGTQKDNINDMFRKNRQVNPKILSKKLSKEIGEKNRNAKLTKEIVYSIRNLHNSGISQREIARRLNVHYANVWAIIHRKSWTHL